MQTTNFKVKNIWGANASPCLWLNPPMSIARRRSNNCVSTTDIVTGVFRASVYIKASSASADCNEPYARDSSLSRGARTLVFIYRIKTHALHKPVAQPGFKIVVLGKHKVNMLRNLHDVQLWIFFWSMYWKIIFKIKSFKRILKTECCINCCWNTRTRQN